MNTAIRLVRVGVVISISAVVVHANIGRGAPLAGPTSQESATTHNERPATLAEFMNIPTSGRAQDLSALRENWNAPGNAGIVMPEGAPHAAASIDPQPTRTIQGHAGLDDIPAGLDLFMSPPGAGTRTHAFNPAFPGGTPIPADFFNPGSDPFVGSIDLQGLPLAGMNVTDTIVERLQDADFPPLGDPSAACPSQVAIPIEIVALSLVSSNPITVTFNGGQNPELWDVYVCLSDLPQPQGIMTIIHECPDGGTFFSDLPVLPKFIFTRAGTGPDTCVNQNTGNPANRCLDAGIFGFPADLLQASGGWVHDPDPVMGIVTVGPGLVVDGNCDGQLETLGVGSSCFVPGIFAFPCDCGTPPHGSDQIKKLTGEAALLAAHGIFPAQDPGGGTGPDPCAGGGNDRCADRIPIFDGLTPYDTTGATTDGVPHAPPLCQFDGQTYHDIWYNYVSTCTGVLNVTMCTPGDAFYDTDLVVYDGCNVCPPGDALVLGCNDDDCVAPSGQNFVSRLPDSAGVWAMNVVAGNCYKIRVGGWNPGDQGPGTISIECKTDSVCTLFTNKDEFEAFNAEHSKILKGIEFFEETAAGTPIVGFTDPLCGGIPNPPFDIASGAEVDGLRELNLCVQSNTLGGGANVPSPHGANGLVFIPFGSGFGENSDLVLANYFVESLDIMFGAPVPPDQQDNHTGVGFDAVSIFGGGFVDIQVYDKNNVLMVMANAPANARGVFWGVWCPDTIGRINIFDLGGGAQGADNIQMWLEDLTGACCDHAQPGGLCIDDLSESDCLNDPDLLQPEWFQGLTCADVEAAGLCEEHTGACCDHSQPGGSCTDDVPQSECIPGGSGQAHGGPLKTATYKAGMVIAEGEPHAAASIDPRPTRSALGHAGLDDIPAGLDLFMTPAGGGTVTDAFNPVNGQPIPADFFGPGSDPFVGSIQLQGLPLAGMNVTDTIVQRLQDCDFPPLGDPNAACPSDCAIEIEIVALSLVSSNPIVVTFNGGQNPELWDVYVCLSDVPQPPGIMTIIHECPDGGTFESILPVQPKLIFTRAGTGPDTCVGGVTGNPANRCLDTGLEGLPHDLFEAFGGWVHDPDPAFGVVTVAPGLQVDGNCDGLLETLGVGSSCFVPGIFAFPCDCGTPPHGSDQAKKLTGEQAQLAAHGILPAQDPNGGGGGPNPCANGGGGDGEQIEWFKDLSCDEVECGEHTGACCDGTTGICVSDVPESECPVGGAPLGPGACSECGPGDHFVDNCPAGQDIMNTAAVVGIDKDLDGLVDVNLILSGPTIVDRGPGAPHQIQTEIVDMVLTGGGVTLRAGVIQGLPPSPGQIIEKDDDPTQALSFFDVFFEISGPWGVLHNEVPLRIEDQIDCLPPQATYRHVITNPIPLLDDAGNVVAQLVTAYHGTFPDQWRWEKDTPCEDLDPPCEEHTGACCDGNTGTCLDNIRESQCPTEDPQFRWEKDTPCADLDPPCEEHTGACCDGTTGNCQDGVPESECPTEDPQFRWEKDTPCADLDPPCEEHTGACCDGSTGICVSDVPQSECPTGDGTELQGPVSVVTEIKSDPVCSDGSDPNVPEPLDVCNVYVHLDPPATELVSVGFADITTSDPIGFYQNPFGGNDVSPNCILIPIFPALVCDSFVTVGTKCYDPVQTAAPGCFWDSAAFNFGGQVAGDWLNADPNGPWGLPDANGNVLVAQLSSRAGHSIGGIFTAYVKGPFGGGGPCPDFDGDGIVGAFDLATVLGNCGPCPGGPCPWDFNGDGVVDSFDIAYVLAHWGPCGAPVEFGAFDLIFECFGQGDECGDGVCAPNESCDSCPLDCGPCGGGSAPCADCGPGPHFVDNCPAGVDAMPTAAVIGIDKDFDGLVDVNLVMSGPTRIARGPGAPHVIETEILSMNLSGGGATMRAGSDFGLPSPGQIVEKSDDPATALSFFDVLFEISGPWGVLHNQVPLRIEDQITCIPPQATYRHVITEPILLLDAAGVPVAQLVTAYHGTFPDQWRWEKDTPCEDLDPPCEEHIGACCDGTTGNCTNNVPESECTGPQRRWQKDTPCEELDPPCEEHTGACCDGTTGICVDNTPESECPVADGTLGPGACSECGPGPHFTDDCPPGIDAMNTAAVLGIDKDLDGLVDVNLVMSGPTRVGRGPGSPHQIDTEILSMSLSGGGATLRAGSDFGLPSPGQIVEKSDDPSKADSFFDVLFEISGPWGVLHNNIPLRIEDQIDCIPPQAAYRHVITAPIPLFDAAGLHVANLVTARHITFPDQFRWEKDTLCSDLEPPCEEHTGACCDGTTGNCQDGVPESECTGPQRRWEKDTLCSDLEPPCTEHTGACCDHAQPGGQCTSNVPESECLGGEIFVTGDPAEFEAFMIQSGKLLKGIEDFEEGFIPAGFFSDLVDPLRPFVPNIDPLGFGFPIGLLEDNVLLQSNDLGENAPFPSPGAGLRGVGPGAIGPNVPNSIVVGTRYPGQGGDGVLSDSLDIIFTEPNHTGIGFDVIDPTAPPRIVHITVFNKNNQVIFKGDIPGTPDKVFFGIWTSQTIGRINLAGESSPGANNGAEYVDNIQMWLGGESQREWFKDELCVEDGGTINCDEHTGACCDGTTGVCTDGVRESDCPVDPADPDNQYRWEKDTLCAELDPPCEEHTGACCDGTTGTCVDDVPESECPVGGDPLGPGACSECGPGDHFVDDCPPGQDIMDTTAVLGIDKDLDGLVDVNLIMSGPTVIDRGPGAPHQIQTEIVDMVLTSGGVTLRAGVLQGQPPSFGQIIEKDEDPAEALSFFDVFFEISGPWGVLHNEVPLHIEDQIDCLPPQAVYRHVITNPIPLLDDAGNVVAQLVTARHITFPDQFRWQKDTLCEDLDPPCLEHTGACCEEETGECGDDVPESQCDFTWEKDVTCGEIGCGCDPDCRRDIDGNGQIDAFDLANLLGCWGPFPPGFPCECFDKDGDGQIRAIDLASLLGSWGPCQP